jgi:hypothetical protein
VNAEAKTEDQRAKDATRTVVNACNRVRRWCRLMEDELPRLDGLALKLRSLDGDLVLKGRSLNGESAEEVRSELISTLLVNGLAFAELTAAFVIFSRYGVRRSYWLTSVYAKRVMQLATSTWPHAKTRPYIEEIDGALIRLALETAETEASFKGEIASQMLTATNAKARPGNNKPPPTVVASFLRAIGSTLSSSSAPSSSATPTSAAPSSMDTRTAVQSAIPSSLELSGTLRLEPATRSTGAPLAATAPPRGSAGSATSAAPSSAARSSRRAPPAGTTGREPRRTLTLVGLQNVAYLEQRGEFIAVVSERRIPWRLRETK